MKFYYTDFNSMRKWIKSRPTAYWQIHKLRLAMFDKFRYQEQYENIYKMIRAFGGEIIFKKR